MSIENISLVKMLKFETVLLVTYISVVIAYSPKNINCGPYGFVCERNRVRLCEGENLFGPAFLCPPNTICNEDSSAVCETAINYVDSTFTRTIKCHRNERIADPNVPGCKGYILCIPNKNRFQGIKFKCSGNTVFNGYSRTCSSPDKYKCPVTNSTRIPEIYSDRRIDDVRFNDNRRGIDCKNYKFRVVQDTDPVRATYFCPSRPVRGNSAIICTIFSNQFCITLEKDEHDQFLADTAYRRPRM